MYQFIFLHPLEKRHKIEINGFQIRDQYSRNTGGEVYEAVSKIRYPLRHHKSQLSIFIQPSQKNKNAVRREDEDADGIKISSLCDDYFFILFSVCLELV